MFFQKQLFVMKINPAEIEKHLQANVYIVPNLYVKGKELSK